MKNVTAVTTTTIKIEFTDTPIIRCVARRDMPEANIKEGSCFYLIRSSKNNGLYYIATWNFERIQWDCRCPATKPCRHMKLIAADCSKQHSIHSYKPLNRAEKFDALKALYDIRRGAALKAAQESSKAELAAIAADVEQYIAEEKAQAATRTGKRSEQAMIADIEDTKARTASLYSNKGFSLLK